MEEMEEKLLAIEERGELRIPEDEFDPLTAKLIHRYFGNKIRIEWPNPLNDNNYVLNVKEGIGQLVIPSRVRIQIVPGLPLVNIFHMLEFTYKIKTAQYLEGIFCLDSLHELFDKLALTLARRILDRGRQGLYQDYINKKEEVSYLRGRLDQMETMRNYLKGDSKFICEFQEHTANNEDNQILAWTIRQISKFNIKDEDTRKDLRQAYHLLKNTVDLVPFKADDCMGRDYNRLNEDYRYMHKLCHFFLDQLSNITEDDQKSYIPITLSMKSLFRSFIAEWIRVNLPRDMALRVRQRVNIEEHWGITDELDIVLYDLETSEPLYLISTLYSTEMSDIKTDIQRAATMASIAGCSDIALVYPYDLSHIMDTKIGDIRIRAIPFPLNDDIEKAGKVFLESLFSTHMKRIIKDAEELEINELEEMEELIDEGPGLHSEQGEMIEDG